MKSVKDMDIEPARYVNMAIGGWLMLSAFLWHHSEPQFIMTILVGSVLAIVAPFELGSPLVRRITAAAGVALVLATIGLPRTSMATFWHNLLFGLAVIGISFFGPPHGIMRPRAPAPDDAYEATGGV